MGYHCTLVIHYVDDFLTISPLNSQLCFHNSEPPKETCKDLVVPPAVEELEGPTTSLTFLGLMLNPADIRDYTASRQACCSSIKKSLDG